MRDAESSTVIESISHDSLHLKARLKIEEIRTPNDLSTLGQKEPIQPPDKAQIKNAICCLDSEIPVAPSPMHVGAPGPLSVINGYYQPDEFMALEVSNSIIIQVISSFLLLYPILITCNSKPIHTI
jgi:hypothetical protein